MIEHPAFDLPDVATLQKRIAQLEEREGLRQTEYEHLKQFFDMAPLAYQSLDENGCFITVNQAWLDNLGYSREEVIGRNFGEFLHPDWQEHFRENFPKFRAVGEILGVEFDMIRKDGLRLLVSFAGRIGRNLQGTFQQTHCIFQDITERRRAEEVLRESDELRRESARLLEGLFDSIPDIIGLQDRQHNIIRYNAAGYRFLGLTPEQVRGRKCYELVGRTEICKVCATAESLRTKQPAQIERYEADLGIWLEVRSYPILDDQGEVIYLIEHLRDITERKEAEVVLRQSEEKFRTVADFTYDWETWKSPDGTYRYVSPSCLRITGHASAEFLADPALIVSIAHPDDKPKLIEHYLATLNEAGEQDLELDFRIVTPDGECRWINHTCTAVYGEGGEWLGRRESNRDISKRKQAEQEKERLAMLNRQFQKAESLGRMAAAIAHHFNNQLHVVKGHLELAIDSLLPTETSSHSLKMAMQAADKAAEVSRMMLVYLGQVTGAHEALDLVELIARLLPDIQAGMPKNIVLESDLNVPGPTVKVNVSQIKQVLTNLITNAWEAAGEGPGAISLSVQVVTAGRIPISNRYPLKQQPGEISYACLEIRDKGCGIAANDLEEVFTPFFSTKFNGRGLGLSVVLGLVQAHNGFVTVESEPGQGSVFRVYLPISEEKILPRPSSAARVPEIQDGGTVLLVDDDRVVLEITGVMLSKLGYTVLKARDGVEAVEVFRQHRAEIRFVLSDLAMPRMNGWETLNALRQMAPELPVILASGYSEEQVMDGNHAEQPQAFLGKPFGFETLKDAVRRTLAGR